MLHVALVFLIGWRLPFSFSLLQCTTASDPNSHSMFARLLLHLCSPEDSFLCCLQRTWHLLLLFNVYFILTHYILSRVSPPSTNSTYLVLFIVPLTMLTLFTRLRIVHHKFTSIYRHRQIFKIWDYTTYMFSIKFQVTELICQVEFSHFVFIVLAIILS